MARRSLSAVPPTRAAFTRNGESALYRLRRLAAATPAAAATAAAPTTVALLPQGPGREAVVKMCSDCHGIETSVAPRHSRTEWQALVEGMHDRGAPGTDDDIRAAVDYLSRHFGR